MTTSTTPILTPAQKRAIRAAVRGQRRGGGRGRTDRPTGAGSGTPIRVIPGAGAPVLVGLPFWKSHFRSAGGRFKKTLYTPSTLTIEVGEQWLANLGL